MKIKTEESGKFFGRSEYMTSVIFNANEEDVGKIVKIKINNSNQKHSFWRDSRKIKTESSINLSDTIKKNIQTSLKFVYSENNTLSVIFHDNNLLMGVVGEFNKKS